VRGIPKGNEFVIEKQKQQRNVEGLLCITQAILCSYRKEGVTMACVESHAENWEKPKNK
jgi:hypothetical protein